MMIRVGSARNTKKKSEKVKKALVFCMTKRAECVRDKKKVKENKVDVVCTREKKIVV